MDACTVNSFGVRGGSAGAVAAYNTGMAADAFTWSNVTSLASAMMTTYKSARSSLDNPTMAVGLSDGSYVEIVSCRYYGCVTCGACSALCVGVYVAYARCTAVVFCTRVCMVVCALARADTV